VSVISYIGPVLTYVLAATGTDVELRDSTVEAILAGGAFTLSLILILRSFSRKSPALFFAGILFAAAQFLINPVFSADFSVLNELKVLLAIGIATLLFVKFVIGDTATMLGRSIPLLVGLIYSVSIVLLCVLLTESRFELVLAAYLPLIIILGTIAALSGTKDLTPSAIGMIMLMLLSLVVMALNPVARIFLVGVIDINYSSLSVLILLQAGFTATCLSNYPHPQQEKKKEKVSIEDDEIIESGDPTRIKDEYVSMVAHELRTPLLGIQGISELLLDGAEGELSADVKRNLELISTSTQRLTYLLNDLRDVSRIQNNLLDYHPEPVHLRSAVNRVFALQYSKAAVKGIELRNQVPKSLANVHVDPNKLEQVLHNLINNSVKFTDEGYVAVDADVQGDRIVITIEDTGQGLSKEHIDRLLNSFREDLTKPVPSSTGSGLGLKITSKLIKLMGSELSMESAEGYGSYFSFSIPVTSEEAKTEDKFENYSIAKRDSERSLTRIFPHRNARINDKFRIMVVDDEPVNIKVLTAQLSRAGYEVISFYHGRDALDYISVEQIPDLILLDIMMPNLNGFDVCKIIREEYSKTELPIIMLTAKSNTADILEGFKSGANDYIAKPIAKDELLARIKTHVELSKINHAFGRFVPHEFLGFLGYESILDIKLGDQVQQNMTVMFTDIKEFTRLSENMTPKEAFDFINTFLGIVSPLIRRSGGFIDKFIGDAIMALFPGGADDALKASLLMRDELKKLNEERIRLGMEPILTGTGMHSGELMLGMIGEEMRMEGTVISDVVNTASRLEGLTKIFDNNIIISAETVGQLKDRDQYHFRYLGKTRIKGKNNVLDVYGVIEGSDEFEVELAKASAAAFEAGIKDFYERNFTRASVHFNEVLKSNPRDMAASIFLKRAAHLMVTGVPDDWSGVDEGSIILEQYS
jgi:two-component system, sensor histidine kinase ChiS